MEHSAYQFGVHLLAVIGLLGIVAIFVELLRWHNSPVNVVHGAVYPLPEDPRWEVVDYVGERALAHGGTTGVVVVPAAEPERGMPRLHVGLMRLGGPEARAYAQAVLDAHATRVAEAHLGEAN